MLLNMKADRIEVARDEEHKNWVIRIRVGHDVIRRHCDKPANADQNTLRDAAIKTASDEGYTVDPANVVVS